jgi:hypothetical protein
MSKLPAASLSLLMILIVSMVLIVNTIERIREFKDYQRGMQEAVVDGAAFAASIHILETKKMVSLFADEYRDLITRLAFYPNDEATKVQLRNRLKARFDNVFTFTIATPEGIPVLSDIETRVGEVCQQDLAEFMGGVTKGHPVGKQNLVSIHPNPSGYHYDVMVPLSVAGVARIFFVSFFPSHLAEIAKTHAPPGQQLLFVHNDNPTLIEIGAGGSREVLGRDIHLSADESRRAKVGKFIAGSKWRLLDIPEAHYVEQYERKLWREVGLIIAFVALISLIMMMYMIRLCRQCDARCN